MKIIQTKLHFTGYKGQRGIYRDKGREFLEGRHCKICDETLERKIGASGRIEEWDRFLKRKTCGMLPNRKKSECLILSLQGNNNPKWRGGKPKCIWCGKLKLWYKTKNDKSINLFCQECWKELQHTPKRYLYQRIDDIIEINKKLNVKN